MRPTRAGAFEAPAPGHPHARRDRDDRDDRRESGLRGRGGAGYPAGAKWRTAAATTDAPRRYVVINGYGADPATGTDRYLLERDPFAVIEGAAIAAFAIGACEVIVAVRADATEAIRRLEAAIGAAEEAGFVGFDVLGSGHDIEVTVRPVQGAYMLGEETVLLKALEGKRGQPEQRPPHPAERGLFEHADGRPQRPDVAAVPWIIRNGADRVRGDRLAGRARARSSSRSGRRPATASRRSRWGRRCARSSASAAGCRPVERSRPSSSAARRAGCCRPTSSTRRTTSSRSAPPAPTSARARSSSPTIAPASSTSPAS